MPDQPITDYINQFMQNIEPENEIGDSLTYRLPVIYRPRLQKLLIHLEIDRKMLGIENVRVVGAELSDIYMTLVTSFRLQQQMIPDVSTYPFGGIYLYTYIYEHIHTYVTFELFIFFTRLQND